LAWNEWPPLRPAFRSETALFIGNASTPLACDCALFLRIHGRKATILGVNILSHGPASGHVMSRYVKSENGSINPKANPKLVASRALPGKDIEGLILGDTRGEIERDASSSAGNGDFFNGLAPPPPNGAGHEFRQRKKSPSVYARALAAN
jgi:hypothetical protein